MRGPASFANCSPCPAPVTIINNNTIIPDGAIRMFQELFSNVEGLARGRIVPLDDPDWGPAPGVHAKYRLLLENDPVGPHSVEVFLAGGTARQRPLIGQNGKASSALAGYPNGNFDFYVDGRYVYICFDLNLETDSINVQYLGIPASAGKSSGPLDVGSQLFVAIPVTHFDYCFARSGGVPVATGRGLYHHSYGLLPGMDNRGVAFERMSGDNYRLVVPKVVRGATIGTQVTIRCTVQGSGTTSEYSVQATEASINQTTGQTLLLLNLSSCPGLVSVVTGGGAYHLEFIVGSEDPLYFSANDFHKYGQTYRGEVESGITEDLRFGSEDFYRQLRLARFNYQPAAPGWLKADGQTVYAIGLYPALYRHLQSQNLIAEAADNRGDGVEQYSRLTHFIIRELTPADPSANLVLLKG